MGLKSVDEILDFAIGKEEEAAQMYSGLAEQMQNRAMSEVFEQFSLEELEHKKKLLGIKDGKQLLLASEHITNLGIADYAVVDTEPSGEMDYQQALLLAMKEEKAAFVMYSQLAAATDNPELQTTLLGLAQEEAKHKLRIEIEYDEYILTEN